MDKTDMLHAGLFVAGLVITISALVLMVYATSEPVESGASNVTDTANTTNDTVTDAERSIVKNITTLGGITGTWAARSCVD